MSGYPEQCMSASQNTLSPGSTIDDLLAMPTEQLLSMSKEEILIYLKPSLEVQPPVIRDSSAAPKQGGTTTKISIKGRINTRDLGAQMRAKGPSQANAELLSLIQEAAAESEGSIDASKQAALFAALTSKKPKK